MTKGRMVVGSVALVMIAACCLTIQSKPAEYNAIKTSGKTAPAERRIGSSSADTETPRDIDESLVQSSWRLQVGEGHPLPVILMSLGRSGSTAIWDVLTTLTGQSNPSFEYTGSGYKKSENFMKNLPLNDGGEWILAELRRQQNKYPQAGIVGFKWKPFPSIYSNQSIAGLQMIAKSSNIRIVRNRRNILDVVISKFKHKTTKVPAHCDKATDNCLKNHVQAGTGMHLKTKGLLEKLNYWADSEDKVDRLLVDLGVPHIHVSYERLLRNPVNATKEWMRIFNFLGRGPDSLTKKELENAMHLQATSSPYHNMTLGNYDEVKSLLTGTKFEDLLH